MDIQHIASHDWLLGLDYVESGPLVRSSYHSEKHVIPGYGKMKWEEEKMLRS